MSGDDFRMHVVKVKICAPDDAPAGLGKAVTIKAHLKGYPKISAAKILQVDVDHVYRLSTDVSLVDNEELTVNPGDSIILPTTVNNNGNGPDRFDYTLPVLPTRQASTLSGTSLFHATHWKNLMRARHSPLTSS